jgi:hypothetical protein
LGQTITAQIVAHWGSHMGTGDFDWEAIDADIKRAGEQTDATLAARISSVSRLTDSEIKVLFPKPADAARLLELMQIVKASTNTMDRANRLADNIRQLGGVVITLLDKFVV